MDKEYALYGFIQGDGDLGRLKSPSHKGIEINIGKKDKDVAEMFGLSVSGRVCYYSEDNIKEKLISLGFDSNTLPQRGFPSTFKNWSDTQKIGFLNGLYSANGSFIKVGRVSFKTTSIKLRDELMDILKYFNLNPYFTTNKSKLVKFSNGEYICKESYDVNLGRKTEIKWFYDNIGFIQKYKMNKINEFLTETK